ncbi:hypothetical protein Desku_2958 [Desulfofundulus kuznetsovii DSM 6115]|uniref:Uncharacterized protein n=1 Tax=Desulfofundulus kuznetsovii (strain DSM 6115 / VKM B-1805 / 17) TaxID=760568 RepID=A0AAU8PG28_DESK7|nr:hypothetical protein Desku_2958 [Desulfofundulus kuznetsovii DSM 6115]
MGGKEFCNRLLDPKVPGINKPVVDLKGQGEVMEGFYNYSPVEPGYHVDGPPKIVYVTMDDVKANAYDVSGGRKQLSFYPLVNFHVAIYEIILVAGREGLILPPYKGSTLRGGFGRVFQRITCTSRQKDCRNCLLNQHCPYAYIFETSPPPGSEALRNYDNVPRPFVLEPPQWERFSARQDSRIKMGGVVGRAVYEGEVAEFIPFCSWANNSPIRQPILYQAGKPFPTGHVSA